MKCKSSALESYINPHLKIPQAQAKDSPASRILAAVDCLDIHLPECFSILHLDSISSSILTIGVLPAFVAGLAGSFGSFGGCLGPLGSRFLRRHCLFQASKRQGRDFRQHGLRMSSESEVSSVVLALQIRILGCQVERQELFKW